MHVGKIAPKALYKDLFGQVVGHYWIPRCWTMKMNGFVFGSLALPWKDLLVTSKVQQVVDVSTRYRWTFEHPTSPNLRWEFDWTMVIHSLTNPQIPNYSTRWFFNYFDGATQLGTGTLLERYLANWWVNLGDGFLHGCGASRVPAIDPAVFEVCTGRMRVASWAEQPNYHPFRWIGDPGEDIEGNPIVLP